MLQGFVDDSGSSDGNVYTLAGLLATAERWEEFSDEWEKICDQEPKTPDFKMSRAFRLKEYRWTEAQRNQRIRELVKLILSKAMYRVDAVLARKNYEIAVKGKLQPEIDSPYFVLFYNVILSFARFMEQARIEGTVDWVFDEQGKIGTECVAWYSWIREQAPPELKRRLGSTPIFRSDTKVLPLKAADIFAWQIRRHCNDEQPQGIELNEILTALLLMQGSSCQVKGEDLEGLVTAINNSVSLRSHCLFHLPRQG